MFFFPPLFSPSQLSALLYLACRRGTPTPSTPTMTASSQPPLLLLFSLTKPPDATSWAEAQVTELSIPMSELQARLTAFQHRTSVLKALGEIPSKTCLARINAVIQDENAKLCVYDSTVQYVIASLEIEWRALGRRRCRQLQGMKMGLRMERADAGGQREGLLESVGGQTTPITMMKLTQSAERGSRRRRASRERSGAKWRGEGLRVVSRERRGRGGTRGKRGVDRQEQDEEHEDGAGSDNGIEDEIYFS